MSDTCPHSTVTTDLNADQQYEWSCITCKLKFIPITARMEMATAFDSKMAMALEISAQTAAYILKSVMGPVAAPVEPIAPPVPDVVEPHLPTAGHGPFFFGENTP